MRVARTEQHHKDVREQSSGPMRSDFNDHHWELRFPQMFGTGYQRVFIPVAEGRCVSPVHEV